MEDISISIIIITQISEKLRQLNEKIAGIDHKVSDQDLNLLCNYLSNHEETRNCHEAMLVLRKLLTWPDDIVFPVLDTCRLIVLKFTPNDQLCTEELFQSVQRHLNRTALPSNQMLTFRLLANMFVHEKGETIALYYSEDILQKLLQLSSFGNKQNQVILIELQLVVEKKNKLDNIG